MCRLGLECRQESTELACRLTQAQLDVAQLVTGAGELRRKLLERREHSLRASDEPGRAFAFVRGERLGRSGRAVRELGDMTKTFSVAAKTFFRTRFELCRVLDECTEFGEPRLGDRGTLLQLLVPASRGGELAPREACLRPPLELFRSDEGVENVELVAGTRETSLLELA